MAKCSKCGEKIEYNRFKTYNGKIYCNECYNKIKEEKREKRKKARKVNTTPDIEGITYWKDDKVEKDVRDFDGFEETKEE